MISLTAAANATASVAALSAQFTQQHLGHKIVPRIVRQTFSPNRGGNLWQLCATASASGSVSACSSATATLSPKQRDTQALPLSLPLLHQLLQHKFTLQHKMADGRRFWSALA